MSYNKLSSNNGINFNQQAKTSSNFKDQLNNSNQKYFPNRTDSFSKFSKISKKLNFENLNDIDLTEYKHQSKLSLRFNRLKENVKVIHEKNRHQDLFIPDIITKEEQNIFSYAKLEIANPLSNYNRKNSKSCTFLSDFLKTTNDKSKIKLDSSKRFHISNKREKILEKIENIITSNIIGGSNLKPVEVKDKNMRFIIKSPKKLISLDLNNMKHHSTEFESPLKIITPLTNNFLNLKEITPMKSQDFNYFDNKNMLRHFSTKNSLKRFSLNKPKISFSPDPIKILNEEKNENKEDYLKYRDSEKKNLSSDWRKLNLTKESMRHTQNNSEQRQHFDLLFATEYNNILHKIEAMKKSINIIFIK